MCNALQVNDRVIGKTKSIQGKQGTITGVDTVGKRKKFNVTWSNGAMGIYSANALQKETLMVQQNSYFVVNEHKKSDLHQSTNVENYNNDQKEDNENEQNETKVNTIQNNYGFIDTAERGDEKEELVDELLCPHGQIWKLNGEVLEDIVKDYQSTRFKWPNDELQTEKTIQDFFCLMFPMHLIPQILKHTNEEMESYNESPPLQKKEFFQFLGIRLVMVIEKRKLKYQDYWSKKEEENTTFINQNYYDRFGMSRNRFAAISKSFRIEPFVESSIVEDPWKPIRSFIDGFNERRKNVIVPGEFITIDECMSAYEGLDVFEVAFTLPHSTKLLRKPKGIGCELKSAADCESGILIKLEIMEGAHANSLKDYQQLYGESTAISLRLTKHYWGSGRTIIADSAFSSVKTAKCLSDRGLNFMGCVKTAHKKFPKKYLEKWFNDEQVLRGKHLTLKTNLLLEDGTTQEIFAVGWKDRKLKSLICTRGTTLDGDPSIRLRYSVENCNNSKFTVKKNLGVERPRAIQMYFDSFSTIDIHDHYRQSSLAFESNWQTRTWWHRLFSTIFGMICTDTYLAYRLTYKRSHFDDMSDLMDFRPFLGKLAYFLIFKMDSKEPINLRKRKREELHETIEVSHQLKPFSKLEIYKEIKGTNTRAKRRCCKCHQKSAFYCSKCSNIKINIFVTLCSPTKNGSKCFELHIREVYAL